MKTDTDTYPVAYGQMILAALWRKPFYQTGTVDPETVAKRRAANRVARRTRKANRG